MEKFVLRRFVLGWLIALLCLACPEPVAARPGDVTGEGGSDLRDAVAALQSASGAIGGGAKDSSGDVDGDGRVGNSEGIFALQVAAGLRDYLTAEELALQLKQPFAPASIEAAASVLRQCGLTVAANDGSVSAATAGSLAVLRLQVRALALETARGGGFLGAELDRVTPPIPLPPDATGVDKQVTFSLLLAAYVKTGDSFGGRFARALMGNLDLARHGEYRYPTLVLYAFMQEGMVPLLAEMEAVSRMPVAWHVPQAAFNPADPCGSVNSFLDDLPATVSGAVGSLGGTSSGLWNTFVAAASVVAGVATNIATDVALGLVRHSPAVTAVRNAMTAAHAVADLNAMFSQWDITVEAAPGVLHKKPGGPDAGVFTVALNNGGDAPSWPEAVENCAQLFQIPLPDFNSADGASVSWVKVAGFNDLALQDATETTLAGNQAKLNFHSANEGQAVHDNPGSQLSRGEVQVKATVSLPGMENLASALASNLNTYVQAGVNGAASQPAQLLGLTAQGAAVVEYHTPATARINFDNGIERLQVSSPDGVDPGGVWSGTFTRTMQGCGNPVSLPVNWTFFNNRASLNVTFAFPGDGTAFESCSFTVSEQLTLETSPQGNFVTTSGNCTQTMDPIDIVDPDTGWVLVMPPIVTPCTRTESYTVELAPAP